MKPEEKARQNIDRLLTAAGWTIQDRKERNLGASQGVAVREYPMSSGPTDYLLFVDRRAVGVIEAKPEGTTLSGVSDQTEKYLTGVPPLLPSYQKPLPYIVREEFGKGNDFCKKITYRTTGDTADNLLASFRNSYNPRIAITVDMVATGTDIKPLECIIFMRNIRSQVYFEQMKGRSTRTISSTDLHAVTPDAHHKTHFVIVDAVGVCENDKTDLRLEKPQHLSRTKIPSIDGSKNGSIIRRVHFQKNRWRGWR